MKAIKVLLITFLIITLAGCSESQKEAEDDFNEVDVEENNAEGSINEDVIDNDSSNETDTELEDSSSENSETEKTQTDDLLSDDDNSDEVLLEADEYQVLDFSELEDENNYETGLVFIVKEGDIWRVVDRIGNVYRVSTSNESVVQGIVNINAIVTKDDEGNNKVSLSRDYEKYEDHYILEVTSSVEEEFSKDLLEKQLNASATSKIDSYTINNVVSEKLGKGIRVITINFNVVPSNGTTAWGSSQDEIKNIEYTFTVYGYESTWILPVKAPLYKELMVSNDKKDTPNTKQFSDNEIQNILENLDGNYELIKVYDNKMFLFEVDETASTSVPFTGLSYVDLDDLSNRSIYKGQVANGISVNDKTYIFTNENLMEIDLVNASIRIVSNLPKYLEMDKNSVKVLGLEESLLTVEISYKTEVITYTIHVINGETTEIDSFKF